jgi:hypothetical protein
MLPEVLVLQDKVAQAVLVAEVGVQVEVAPARLVVMPQLMARRVLVVLV